MASVAVASSPRVAVAVDSLVALHTQPLTAVVSPSPSRPKRKRKRQEPDAEATAKAIGFPLHNPPLNVSRALQREFARKHPTEFKQWRKARLETWWRRAHKREREQRLARWLTHGTELPPHMTREVPTLPEAPERPEPAIAIKVEEKLIKTYRQECTCGACCRVRYERPQMHETYVCRMAGCRQTFRDIVTFMNHQVDSHATINVHCKRTRQEYYRMQVGPVFPPETVFIVFQYMNVSEPPIMWTLERVERENEMLETHLTALRTNRSILRSVPKRFIRASFKVAYEKVQRYGIAELKEQYRIALEHYEAALVYPVGPRNRQDGISTVRMGRNWLLSPEPENADVSRVIKLVKHDDEVWKAPDMVGEEESEEEEEVVLFEIGRNEESLNHKDVPLMKKAKTTSVDTVQEVMEPVKTKVKTKAIHRTIEEPKATSV